MSTEDPQSWPYKTLGHWPPMTYRDRKQSTDKDLAAFNDYLNSESQVKGNKELQPWIPFCDGRCAFCYFPVSCRQHNVSEYVASLKKALSMYAQTTYVQSCVFNEVYIGGGSPSVLATNQITDIIQHCRNKFNLSPDHSVKFTACTSSLTHEKVRLLAANKVDQVDVGIQTFNNSRRKLLMLQDSGAEAKAKLKDARKNGLRVSIDLLYNLPEQTVEQWEEDLNQALELEVESVDCYPLDLYPDTPLAKQIASGKLPSVNNGSTELNMYLKASSVFRKNGYSPSCHNRFTRIKEDLVEPSSEVIGTGAGFFMGRAGKFLYSDIENVENYLDAVSKGDFPISTLATLTKEEEMRNAMMLIYVRVPVDRQKFRRQFGKLPEEAFPDAIKRLRQKQLIEVKDDKIQLTEKGDPWRFNIAWEFSKGQ